MDLESFVETWTARVWNSSVEEGQRAIRELVRPDCSFEGVGGDIPPLTGPEEYIPYWLHLRQAFPDIHMTVETVKLDRDEPIGTVTFTIRGTHSGEEFMGLRRSNRKIEVGGMSTMRLVDGRVAHALTAFDVATMLEQLRHQVDSVERAIPKPERP